MTTDVRLASFALSLYPTSDVLCAYAAPVAQLMGDLTGRWICLGSFILPTDLRGRLWAIGFRTTGVNAQVGLFAPGLLADSVVPLSSDTDAEVRSLPVDLSAGTIYQIGYRVISAESPYNYAVIRTVSLSPP